MKDKLKDDELEKDDIGESSYKTSWRCNSNTESLSAGVCTFTEQWALWIWSLISNLFQSFQVAEEVKAKKWRKYERDKFVHVSKVCQF